MSALIILLIGMVGDALATRLGRLNQQSPVGVQTGYDIMSEQAPERPDTANAAR